MMEYREDSPTTDQAKRSSFWASKSFRQTAAATLIDVASAIAAAQAIETLPAFCCTCKNAYNPNRSAAQFTNVFCSAECEHGFVQTALASLTIEDCISVQERLAELFAPPAQSAVV
jgi:hypothetical protein